jgi:hypothetical protein
VLIKSIVGELSHSLFEANDGKFSEVLVVFISKVTEKS